MNFHFGPCRPLSMSSRYFLFLLSSSRSKANQQRSLVPFRLLQNLWHRGLQNVLLENIPCFSILRESLNGRLFHGYLRTSSGWWWRQLKSNIGFLVLTKNCLFLLLSDLKRKSNTFQTCKSKSFCKVIFLYLFMQRVVFLGIVFAFHRGKIRQIFYSFPIYRWLLVYVQNFSYGKNMAKFCHMGYMGQILAI